MSKIKFQEPYLVMGHLSHFMEQNQLPEEERYRLEENGKKMKDVDDITNDEPKWIQNKPLDYIRTLEKIRSHNNSEVPNKAYIVQHNGTDFVIGSRGNKEDPVFVSFAPKELFEIE